MILNSRHLTYQLCLFALFITGCKSGDPGLQPASYDPPGSTDTRSKPIEYQVQRIFRLDSGSLSVSNEFPGARLNDFHQLNDTLFTALIKPENAPVNRSPWYAFKIWSDKPREIDIRLDYEEGSHRYYPEYSPDGITWYSFDSTSISRDTTSKSIIMALEVNPDTLYIAAQELIASQQALEWAGSLALKYPFITSEIIGYSTLGKPLAGLKIGNPESNKVVAVLGRQHPPEITGFQALQSFIEQVTGKSELAQHFREQFLLVMVPVMNPDGIDLGHWRHNAGGVDLNRDWQYFHQPETRAAKSYFERIMQVPGRELVFEIDFHSTSVDLFYVFPPDKPSNFTGLTHRWLDTLEAKVPGYEANRVPSDGNSPVSTRWFHKTFGAEAVTYEVGDNTPRKEIQQVAAKAAESMMEILLNP